MTDDGCTGEGRGRGHTYTAAEVKVLTETAGEAALKIGRAEATRDVIREVTVWVSELEDEALWDRWTAKRGTMLRARIPREASGTTSDATSGVPGHPEVSEAVRSPQEPRDGAA
jgi:hypothetical protein